MKNLVFSTSHFVVVVVVVVVAALFIVDIFKKKQINFRFATFTHHDFFCFVLFCFPKKSQVKGAKAKRFPVNILITLIVT